MSVKQLLKRAFPDSVLIAKSDRIPIGVVFAQYIDYDNAENAIKAINDVESPLLGSAIRAQFATKDRVPDWTRLHIPPSDTIRLWNVPSLALRSKDLLRRAFSHQQGLLDIRIRTFSYLLSW